MADRIALSKKIRFEVFKRDKFTCQYCGQKAPDTVLQADHIDPVASGGTNEIVNLITSCFDCNNGKRDKKLDDNSVVEKQRKQLDLLQERREQIELMFEWKRSLATFENDVLDMFEEYVNTKIKPFSINDTSRNTISNLINKFKIEQILDGIDEAAKKYIKYEKGEVIRDSAELFLSKIGGVINFKNMPPINQKIAYIKGIARNRYSTWNEQNGSILLNNYILACRNYGWNDDKILEDLEQEVIPITKEAENWYIWKNVIESWTSEINNRKMNNSILETPAIIGGNPVSSIQDAMSECTFCCSSNVILYRHSLCFTNEISKSEIIICGDCLQNESDCRPEEERKLLESVRIKKFSQSHVSEIAHGIENMKDFHVSDVMASVISWAFQNDTLMKKLCEMYFEELINRYPQDAPF